MIESLPKPMLSIDWPRFYVTGLVQGTNTVSVSIRDVLLDLQLFYISHFFVPPGASTVIIDVMHDKDTTGNYLKRQVHADYPFLLKAERELEATIAAESRFKDTGLDASEPFVKKFSLKEEQVQQIIECENQRPPPGQKPTSEDPAKQPQTQSTSTSETIPPMADTTPPTVLPAGSAPVLPNVAVPPTIEGPLPLPGAPAIPASAPIPPAPAAIPPQPSTATARPSAGTGPTNPNPNPPLNPPAKLDVRSQLDALEGKLAELSKIPHATVEQYNEVLSQLGALKGQRVEIEQGLRQEFQSAIAGLGLSAYAVEMKNRLGGIDEKITGLDNKDNEHETRILALEKEALAEKGRIKNQKIGAVAESPQVVYMQGPPATTNSKWSDLGLGLIVLASIVGLVILGLAFFYVLHESPRQSPAASGETLYAMATTNDNVNKLREELKKLEKSHTDLPKLPAGVSEPVSGDEPKKPVDGKKKKGSKADQVRGDDDPRIGQATEKEQGSTVVNNYNTYTTVPASNPPAVIHEHHYQVAQDYPQTSYQAQTVAYAPQQPTGYTVQPASYVVEQQPQMIMAQQPQVIVQEPSDPWLRVNLNLSPGRPYYYGGGRYTYAPSYRSARGQTGSSASASVSAPVTVNNYVRATGGNARGGSSSAVAGSQSTSGASSRGGPTTNNNNNRPQSYANGYYYAR